MRGRRCAPAMPSAAVRALTELLPDWRTRYRSDGTHGIDYGRTYFLRAARHARRRRRAALSERTRRRLEARAGGACSSGVRTGCVRLPATWATTRRCSVRPTTRRQHKLDPHMTYALADVKASDLPGRHPRAADACGHGQPLRSDARQPRRARARLAARVHRVDRGRRATGRTCRQMEFSTLDRWNVSALEMIYYYRAHAPGPRGRRRLRICGSPHDLATVESLALALPQGSGLDQTLRHGCVDRGRRCTHASGLQTKGEYFAYFDASGDQWTALAESAGRRDVSGTLSRRALREPPERPVALPAATAKGVCARGARLDASD
jgi:hypothetical protein